MSDPWSGDACSLVDEFRAGRRSPVEEMEATRSAIERSELDAFSFVDADAARELSETADVSLPFGGVPIGVKELTDTRGWPRTEATLATVAFGKAPGGSAATGTPRQCVTPQPSPSPRPPDRRQ
jgi:Asp-tRNA(Asn)/Glu-tRNA(Gln) amidotransferase A subunit family amidase